MTGERPYTLADLQAIDDQCMQIASEDLGFDVAPVVYHLVRPEEIYYSAAAGLPSGLPSSRTGAIFDQQYGDYQAGRGRIYELIFNTVPVHAYLMDGNSLTAQTLIIAHCLGHAWTFENNGWLGAVDRQIMGRVKSAAERVEDYMAAHGRDRVEDFMDACQSIALHQSQAQLIKPAPALEPEYRPTRYDALFPDEVAQAKREAELERDELRRRFPREPEGNLLAFIEQHARGLEDWQRDIMSIIRSQQSYFLPQMRTKILNEGAAVFFHQEIVQRLFLPADRYWEYEQLNASVVRPMHGQVNPYHLGITLLREVMRIAEEGDEEERERWPWAGQGDGLGQVRRIIRDYDDEALLREFLTPKACEKAQLYAFEHTRMNPRQIRVSSRECDKIRDILIPQHATFGIPHVAIVDADYRGRGELYLTHDPEGGKGLDAEYAKGTLCQIATLWGKPATVVSVRDDKPIWFTGRPDGTSAVSTDDPISAPVGD